MRGGLLAVGVQWIFTACLLGFSFASTAEWPTLFALHGEENRNHQKAAR